MPEDYQDAMEIARRLERDSDALRADAERYRWLRDGGNANAWTARSIQDEDGTWDSYPIFSAYLDAAIDAAKQEGK
jgi:hypothetical protein